MLSAWSPKCLLGLRAKCTLPYDCIWAPFILLVCQLSVCPLFIPSFSSIPTSLYALRERVVPENLPTRKAEYVMITFSRVIRVIFLLSEFQLLNTEIFTDAILCNFHIFCTKRWMLCWRAGSSSVALSIHDHKTRWSVTLWPSLTCCDLYRHVIFSILRLY